MRNPLPDAGMLKKVESEETISAVVDVPRLSRAEPFLESRLWYVLRGVLQLIVMVAILFGAYKFTTRMIAEKPPTQSRPAFKTVYTIQTVTANKADNQPQIVSYGQTVAARSVDLRSLVSGEIVSVSPNLRDGARVEKGETLVSIDTFNYQGALQEAKANLAEAAARMAENRARITLEEGRLESAKEQLSFAEADLERANELRKRGTSTQQQLEARKLVVAQRRQSMMLSRDTIKVEEARLGQMQAAIDRLEWRVVQAQRNLDSTQLIAPFSGIIRTSAAEKGRLVSANDVVVSMYEEGQLEARFTLTDAQFGRLQADQVGLIDRPVQMAWTIGGKTTNWSGRIDRLGSEITSNRGGVQVFAVMDIADRSASIRPGAFVEVTVPDTVFRQTVSVPDTAIYTGDTVYVAVDGKLVEKKVEIAAYDGENALIQSGVENGDEILITRITEVSAGLSVRKEGDASGPQSPAKSGQNGNRPSREEMAKILKASGMSFPEFRELPQEKKRELITKWRSDNPAVSSN